MRKTFLTESLARLLRGAIGIACLAAACVSCETHSNSDRSESIAVYADPIEKKPVDAVYVGVQGGQAKIYAEANVDFVASWEDDADMPWAAVLDDTAVDPLTGCRIVTLDVQRRVETGCYYTRRTGMLILAATDGTLNYNRIVPVHQGSRTTRRPSTTGRPPRRITASPPRQSMARSTPTATARTAI